MHPDLAPVRIFKDPKVQARYERNREQFFAEVGETVERVATIFNGRHSSLCFSPAERGADFGCCCGSRRYELARAAIAVVEEGLKSARFEESKDG